MALRVLLADESSTIKKVFQLALQDFAVEVVTVNVGLDVQTITERIQPDIIFADVLLQKKNGYDVCAELKANPIHKDIPVVLIWSGFMDLDEDKYQASGANAHLEKPFDAERLRLLVNELVPKTKAQTLSKYLSFPSMPEFEESESVPGSSHQPTQAESSSWDMGSFQAIETIDPEANDNPPPISGSPDEEFQQVQFTKPSAEEEPSLVIESPRPSRTRDDSDLEFEDDGNDWVQKSLSNYRLDLDSAITDGHGEDPVEVYFEIPEVEQPRYKGPDEFSLDTSAELEVEEPAPIVDTSHLSTDAPSNSLEHFQIPKELLESKIEEYIQKEAHKIIEDVVWKVVPELATQMIQKEINRLMQDFDKNL